MWETENDHGILMLTAVFKVFITRVMTVMALKTIQRDVRET
jgi:hypothetical protein